MNSWRSLLALLPVAICLGLGSAHIVAASRALEIMREVDHGQRTTSRSNIGAVEVIDRKGKILRKRWSFTAEGYRGDSKVLVRFSDPPEVRGVGLLTLNHQDRPAEQWLYTPAIKRDRRIASQEKSGRFMGTDFSNEDMEERSVENYDYDQLADDVFDRHPTYKVKGVYRDRENTQYSYLIFWVRKDIMVTTFTEFYVGHDLRKTLAVGDFQLLQGIWTPQSMEMKDLVAGSTTRVRLSDIAYNATFEPDWFTLRNLRKDW